MFGTRCVLCFCLHTHAQTPNNWILVVKSEPKFLVRNQFSRWMKVRPIKYASIVCYSQIVCRIFVRIHCQWLAIVNIYHTKIKIKNMNVSVYWVRTATIMNRRISCWFHTRMHSVRLNAKITVLYSEMSLTHSSISNSILN